MPKPDALSVRRMKRSEYRILYSSHYGKLQNDHWLIYDRLICDSSLASRIKWP